MKPTSALLIASTLILSLLLLNTPSVLARGGGGGHGGGGFHGVPSTQPQNDTSVYKDQLSSAEVERLKARIETVAKLSETLDGDAKLTKDELTSLSDTLTAAAASIWSKGTDDKGEIITRFGDKFSFVTKLAELLKAGPVTRPQDRDLLKNFSLIMKSRLSLNEGDLNDADRAKTQKAMDDLITKYFAKA